MAPIPLDSAAPKVRRQITLRNVAVAARSARMPAYETLEVHLVHAKLGWDAAIEQVAGLSSRLDTIVETTMLDAHEAAPVCANNAPVPAMPLDNISVDEAAAMLQLGWQMVDVVRFWPGGEREDPPEAPDHDARAERTAARAKGRYWAYYRSTGWGFIYPKPAPRRRGR